MPRRTPRRWRRPARSACPSTGDTRSRSIASRRSRKKVARSRPHEPTLLGRPSDVLPIRRGGVAADRRRLARGGGRLRPPARRRHQQHEPGVRPGDRPARAGNVLLFPGDAQVGNWESWFGKVEVRRKASARTWSGRRGKTVTADGPAPPHRALQGRPPRQPQRHPARAGPGVDGMAPTAPANSWPCSPSMSTSPTTWPTTARCPCGRWSRTS